MKSTDARDKKRQGRAGAQYTTCVVCDACERGCTTMRIARPETSFFVLELLLPQFKLIAGCLLPGCRSIGGFLLPQLRFIGGLFEAL